MRLIDADKLIEKITASIMLSACGRTNGKTIRTNVLKEMRKTVAEFPTFDAIPVTWIEQYGKANWYDFGTQYNAITKMLEEWERKEE